jgi:hypothetical protein
LRHERVIDLVNLEATPDAGEKRYRELAAEVLLEFAQTGEDREPAIGISGEQGIIPERKTERFEQPADTGVFPRWQQAGEGRITGIESNPDSHGLPMA